MKKIAFFALTMALLLASATTTNAQVSQTESGIVYYMPHTQLCIDVEYEEITLKQGPFYQYAERYLATKDVVSEEGVRYQLRSVTLRTRTTADKERAYVLASGAKKVALTKQGLLYGIGIEMPEKEKSDKASSTKMPKESIIDNPFAGLLEDQMLASSVSKMAEGTAKQIYHIREARLNWLCGEVENMPADGESMEMILKQLDRQEKQLTALFLGTEKRKTLHHYIYLEPEDCTDQVVFRFSALQGIVDADNLSGEPYYLSASCQKQQYSEEAKKSAAPSQLYYNLPGSLKATLSDGVRVIQEKTIQVGQFGISVALPAATLKNAKAVRLDPQSGALIAVE